MNGAMVLGSDEVVVLADVSGSMSARDAGEGIRRIDAVRNALKQLPKSVRIIAFSDRLWEVRSAYELPEPNMTTDLALAIRSAAMHSPVRTVIISDGEPNSETDAIDAADNLTGVIDVIYCGPLANTRAREFLNRLAKRGMGSYYETGDQVEIGKQLPAVIKGLLGS